MKNTAKNRAFTLAEVLITLGIIGIVAAMTLPTLIQKHRNNVVETRLKKFYSVMNQAILMAEKDYGDKKIWYQDLQGVDLDEDGKPIAGSSEQEKWFKKYIAPYIKITETKINSSGIFEVYFADGSLLKLPQQNTRDWSYYTSEKCISGQIAARCQFHFEFVPNNTDAGWKHHYNKGLEPWKYNWDGKEESLKEGCYSGEKLYYCTAYIQLNGWKIPDDYPYKVRY